MTTLPKPLARSSPRIFYGWWIVLIAFCGSFITAGTGGYIFGQFIEPLSNAFGWSVGFVSSITLVRSLSSIVIVPLVGRITDRIGSRPVMLTGALLCGITFLLLSLITNPLIFYVLMSVVISIGYSTVGGIPSQAAVARWFRRRRGMAISLSTLGISVGGIVMVPLTQNLLDSVGWRFTLGAIGVGILIVMLPPVFFLMRDYPEQMGLQPDGEPLTPTAKVRIPDASAGRPAHLPSGRLALLSDSPQCCSAQGSLGRGLAPPPTPRGVGATELAPPQPSNGRGLPANLLAGVGAGIDGLAVASPVPQARDRRGAQTEERTWTSRQVLSSSNFWKQALGYMFAFAMLQVTLVLQFPFITNRGFDRPTAALIVTGYAVSAAASRFLWGFLADRYNVNRIAVFSIWLAAIGVIILIFAYDLPLLWLYALIGGMGIGGLVALQGMVTAVSFGRRSYGTVAGLLNPMNMIASALAVPFAGYMFDLTHTYNVSFSIVVALAMVTSLSLLTLPSGGAEKKN